MGVNARFISIKVKAGKDAHSTRKAKFNFQNFTRLCVDEYIKN
jgi:hypothetical protein